MRVHVSSNSLGNPIDAAVLGGEYLGWTGFPGFEAQAQAVSIGHLRWPGGINAEDRIDSSGYAYDLSTPNVVDNWDTWNGSAKAGITETMGYARENGLSYSMIVPSARYVEMAMTDYSGAIEWLKADIEAFTARLASNQFGDLPYITLEVGAEYYSTDIWEETQGAPETLHMFANIFSNLVSELALAEETHGELYEIAVQMGRFQSRDDPEVGMRDGEASDSLVFLDEYESLGVLQEIDSVVWHRYTERFDQIDDAFRQSIHHSNSMSTLLANHREVWETRVGGELDLVVSWLSPDIDSSGDETNTDFDHGPRSAHNILQMFSEVAASGADVATVYGMDTQWPGSLSYGTPSNPEIYFGGAVYGLLSESVVGLSVTSTYEENFLPLNKDNSIIPSDHANFFSFDGSDRAVIIAAASKLTSDAMSIELNHDDMHQFDFVRITKLTPIGDDAFATAERNYIPPIEFLEDSLWFDFDNDFEVVRVELFEDIPVPSGREIVDTYHRKDGTVTQVIGTAHDIGDPNPMYSGIADVDHFLF
ncbi:MAG: hypothetical protein AAGM21_02595 [Pseudomonadota bacterium]